MTAVLASESEGSVLLPATYDIVWSLVVFVVLFVLFWKFVLPKYLSVLDDRTAKIQGGLEKAERAQAEADAKLKAYGDQLAEAREEAGRIREQARGEGAAIIAEMRERAQSEADRVTEQAQRQLEAERQQALAQLHREVGRLAVDLAGRVVGESLSDDDRQRRVVDRFLADLERGDAERAQAAERARAEREEAQSAASYEAAGRAGSSSVGGGTA
ncbi:F0F1 ATP synthase subunit B [Aquipuribacter hungaricus]|uniref:ATP synthase subunit b n=1 Tax=Aquipuribacter hungaricus TaxID=545624 RepID=A0ABV7WFB0_9MICO